MGWSTALTGWVGSAELYEETKIQDKKYSHFFFDSMYENTAGLTEVGGHTCHRSHRKS